MSISATLGRFDDTQIDLPKSGSLHDMGAALGNLMAQIEHFIREINVSISKASGGDFSHTMDVTSMQGAFVEAGRLIGLSIDEMRAQEDKKQRDALNATLSTLSTGVMESMGVIQSYLPKNISDLREITAATVSASELSQSSSEKIADVVSRLENLTQQVALNNEAI